MRRGWDAALGMVNDCTVQSDDHSASERRTVIGFDWTPYGDEVGPHPEDGRHRVRQLHAERTSGHRVVQGRIIVPNGRVHVVTVTDVGVLPCDDRLLRSNVFRPSLKAGSEISRFETSVRLGVDAFIPRRGVDIPAMTGWNQHVAVGVDVGDW